MIKIKTGLLRDAVDMSQQIPEFTSPYSGNEFAARLQGNHLILTAYIKGRPAGFKIGYDRFNDGSFYSWIGGVLPEFRRNGAAGALAEHQEMWAKEQGYRSIKLKTRNKHKAMVAFSLKRGFVITGEIPKIPAAETRLWMKKIL